MCLGGVFGPPWAVDSEPVWPFGIWKLRDDDQCGLSEWFRREGPNSLTDLTGNTITPIPTRETFENSKSLYPGENWTSSPLVEATWSTLDWVGNSYFDTYALCYATPVPPQVAPVPPTVPWNPAGGTAISSNTQKYWIGSYSRFQGACTQRQTITWFTNHTVLSSKTTPITNAAVCNIGQYSN